MIVERFDRRLSNDSRWIVRLPQEDMCQPIRLSGRAVIKLRPRKPS
ncbi:hypothetical protein ACIOG3_18100 [Yersinia rochesterensis]|nr:MULTISPECIES: hypothetical protein [Yersinia]